MLNKYDVALATNMISYYCYNSVAKRPQPATLRARGCSSVGLTAELYPCLELVALLFLPLHRTFARLKVQSKNLKNLKFQAYFTRI